MYSSPILAVATRNAIKKANPTAKLEFGLRNIVINGQKRGCSGFVHDPATGHTVYVNTESSCIGLGYLVRSALSKEKAGCGSDGANYHEKDLAAIARRVHALLREPHFITDWQQYRAWASAQCDARMAA